MDDARQAPAEQAPAAGQPPRGSLARGCLRTALGLLLLVILIGVLGATIWYRTTVSPIKASEPYQMALELAQKDPEVIKQLGEPIKEVFWPPPSATGLEGGPGRATLHFGLAGPNAEVGLAGPKAEARVEAEGRMIEGKWGLALVKVTIAGTGQQIKVDTAEKSGLDEAPKFKPGG